ncbi:MAG TPA: VOC family protein [Candidatus Paceibacterota bacterium]|nr:VOC family protein [Candidatus Paceibacterota bacterium]
MSTLLGLVRRVSNRDKTVSFYKLLGLDLFRHQHGVGPLHFGVGPVHPDFVIEIYQESHRYPRDALMVRVNDLAATILLLKRQGINVHITVREGYMVYVKDPDGMDVMLVQK